MIKINGISYPFTSGQILVIIGREILIEGSRVGELAEAVRDIKIEYTGPAQNITTNGNITVTEGGCGNVTADGNADITGGCGHVTADGNADITGDSGNVTADGDVYVGGNVVGNVTTDGDVTVAGNVEGNITTDGDVKVGSRSRK